MSGQSKEVAQKWANGTFNPHLSLVYSTLWPVPEHISKGMERDVVEANVRISCSDSGCDSKPHDTMNGWQGGMILLVSGLTIDVEALAIWISANFLILRMRYRSKPTTQSTNGFPWLRE